MAKGFKTHSHPSEKQNPASDLERATDYQQVHQQLSHHFEYLEDPRGKQGVLHPFMSIVMIALLATIGGAQGWEDIEVYGESHQQWLSSFLALPYGVPSSDTYRRLFERISPTALEQSFKSWLKSLVSDLGAQVIPIDGKTLKGSYDRKKGQSSLQMVSAWASENRLFLGQVKVEDKSNEITAIPSLLDLLELRGCIITIDAMGTQHEIARQIISKGADYVLTLKANHPTLLNQVKQYFETAETHNSQETKFSYDVRVNSGHHRQEKRQVWAVSIEQIEDLYKQAQWEGLQTLVKVVRTRHLWNKTTEEKMFYLSSLAPNAQQLAQAIRQHWSIENQLHWVLDVTFGEDSCRIRSAHAPENMALLKRWSLNLLNQETSSKRSIRQKARRASMDQTYMLKVLESLKTLPINPSSS